MSTRPFKKGKLNDGVMPVRERLTFADEWQEFQRAILPLECSLTQRVETKRAFYAGARVFMRLTMGNLDADHEPTELDVQYMDALNNELLQFARELGSAAEVKAAQSDAIRK